MTEREQNQVSAALADAAMGVRPQDQNMPQVRRSTRPSKPSRRGISMDDFSGEDEPASKLLKRIKPLVPKPAHWPPPQASQC